MSQQMLRVSAIGHVVNAYEQPESAEEARKQESRIVLETQYVDGLFDVGKHRYLDVIFHFHRSKHFDVRDQRRREDRRGVFASRSPVRPAPLGVTTVELLRVEGSELVVRGLDAFNGTPVLDIKPHVDAGVKTSGWRR